MKRIILSGGGTGGHIYPAVAVAEALKGKWGDEVELLFVGAEGKMEMDKIPALGYRIVGLPILGLQRRFTWKNFTVPFRVLRSISKARRTIRDFGADAVVGFGGYASAPVLWAAQRTGVPTVIQEQNSGTDRGEALAHYGLSLGKPVVLVVGGSLGTRTLNEMMKSWILSLDGKQPPVQVIWQTGKYYEKEMREFLAAHPAEGIWQGAFIERMDFAYAAADAVISRSGACTVSELCLVAKPTIFVPSPNVAEDHQTKNAMALVDKDAAMIVRDSEAVARGMAAAIELTANGERLQRLSRNIASLAIADSADRIVAQIEKIW